MIFVMLFLSWENKLATLHQNHVKNHTWCRCIRVTEFSLTTVDQYKHDDIAVYPLRIECTSFGGDTGCFL